MLCHKKTIESKEIAEYCVTSTPTNAPSAFSLSPTSSHTISPVSQTAPPSASQTASPSAPTASTGTASPTASQTSSPSAEPISTSPSAHPRSPPGTAPPISRPLFYPDFSEKQLCIDNGIGPGFMGDFSQYGYQSKKECCEVCLLVIPAFLASELK